jgi:hypothetical protein
MRAALATLLCVAPAKITGEVQAEEDAGNPRWRTLASVIRRPVLQSTRFHTTDADHDHPPEGDEDAGPLGALHERRAEREGDDHADDREHPQRLGAQGAGRDRSGRRRHPQGLAGGSSRMCENACHAV